MSNAHAEPSELSPIRIAIRRAAERLAVVSNQPAFDAELLLRHVLGREKSWLLAHAHDPLPASDQTAYNELIERRLQHEPVQYILGEQEFYGLGLRVTPDVLIPRPETEHLVEAVLDLVPHDRPLRIADVGTGSGAIAIALAHALPLAVVDAVDFSRAALAVAEENARAHGLSARIRFHYSDLLTAVSGDRFDCIVSNPPYVAASEVLEPQVALWEPHGALFAGEYGLDVYERLLPAAAAMLNPGGLLALEIGAGQQAGLAALFARDTAAGNWSEPVFRPDLQGIARVALAFSARRISA